MVRHICSRSPEAGGFFFGYTEEDTVYVVHFQYDANGATTGASYVPSEERDEIINSVQEQTGLYFLGVVHSHPDGIEQPSGPDSEAMEAIMDVNPTITMVVAPIINRRHNYNHGSLQEHQLPLGDGHKIGTFIKFKGRNNHYCMARGVLGVERPVHFEVAQPQGKIFYE